jgi:hypothetical protein
MVSNYSPRFVLSLSLSLSAPFAAAGCGDFVASDDNVSYATLDAHGGSLRLAAFSMEVPAMALNHPVTLSVHRQHGSHVSDDYLVEPEATTFVHGVGVRITFVPGTSPPIDELFVANVRHTPTMPLGTRTADPTGAVDGVATSGGIFAIVQCPAGVCP